MYRCESCTIKKAATAAAAAKLLQSCPTLCDPIDSSLPGSSIPGIFQARVLEWVAIDKPLARIIKKKKERGQINKVRNEKGEVTTDTTEIQRIIRDYYYNNYMSIKRTA